MQFDNSKFNSNVDSSINSINKLKSSLTFDQNSFDGLDKAVSNIPISNLATETERSSGIMANAIQKIIDGSLYALGMKVEQVTSQIVTMFTTQPVGDGFREYELKMGSVQTIMASTGASVEEVNKYLDELNTYSDRTIYSFSDMTQNIGKFTNAGVKLEDAVKAIQGISNEAAVSGANANEASRAMYNFAQALSAGYVKLIDWKSIENANMATVEFKNELIKTALELGTVADAGEGMYQVLTTNASGSEMDDVISATHNFNDSLAYQWMTTEVLTTTLAKYADETTDLGKKAFAAAQDIKTFSQLMDTLKEAAGSGWAQTWQILFGDFEEAKQLWTQINNIVSPLIDGANDARNALLQGWKDLGGRQDLIDSLMNIVDALKALITPIKEAFQEIFPPVTAQQLKNISGGLKELTSRLILSSSAADTLKNIFKSLFSAIKSLGDAVGFVLKLLSPILDLAGRILTVIGSIIHGLINLVSGVSGTASGLSNAKDAMSDFGKAANNAGTFVNGLTNFITKLIDSIKNLIKQIKTSVSDAGGGLKGIITAIGNTIFDLLEKLTGLNLEGARSTIVGFLSSVGKAISDSLGPALPVLAEFIGAIGKNLLAIIKELTSALSNSPLTTLLGGLEITALIALIKKIKSSFGSVSSIADSINEIFETLNNNLKTTQQNVKSKTIKNIAEAIALLSASLLLIAQIDGEKLAVSLGAVTVAMAELVGAMALMNGFTTKNSTAKSAVNGIKEVESIKSTGIIKVGVAMIELAAALDLMALAISKLAGYDLNQMAVGLGAMTVILAEMVAVGKAIQALNIESFAGVSISMILLAKAVDEATDPVMKLASLDIEKAIQGVIGIGVVMAELVAMSAAIGKLDTAGIKDAIGLDLLASAVSKVGDGMYKLASIDVDKLMQGIGGIAGAMGILVGTSVAMSKELTLSTSVGLIMVAESLKIMADAIKSIGSMSIENIAWAFESLTAAMLLLVTTTNLIKGNLASTGAGLIVCGIGLQFMASAIEKMGNIDVVTMIQGLAGIGGALVVLGVGMRALESNIGGAISLGIVSIGLIALATAIQMFGSMDLGQFGKAMLIVAGALVELGIAMYAMTGAIAGAAALTLVSVGLLALAAALAILSAVNDPAMLLITMAGALVIFGGVAAIMGLACAPMIAFAAAIAVLAAAMLLIVGVVAVFAIAIELLATAMTTFAEGLKVVAQVVNENLVSLTAANAFFLEFADTGLLAGAGLLVLGAGSLVAGAGIAVLAGAAALIGLTGDKLNKFLSDLVENCSNFGMILEAAAGLLALGAALSAFALETMGLVATSVGISKFSSAVVPLLQSLVAYATASDKMAGASMQMIKYGEAGADVAKYIADTLKSHVDTFNAGAAAFYALSTGMNATVKSILSLDVAVERLNKDCILTNELGRAFIDIFTYMSDVVGSLAENLSSNMNRVTEAFNAFAQQMQVLLQIMFKALTESITNNVNSMIDFVIKALHSDTLKMGLYADGQYLVDGFREGIESRAMDVAKAAAMVAQKADNAVRETLDIHSPSRVFRAIGEFVDLGFAQGIDGYAGKVTNSATSVANNVISSVGDALNNIPEIDANMDINPVIAPVLDMSNIENGARGISSMFDAQRVSLSGSIDKLQD